MGREKKVIRISSTEFTLVYLELRPYNSDWNLRPHLVSGSKEAQVLYVSAQQSNREEADLFREKHTLHRQSMGYLRR